jgi:hypothetical protein
MSRKSIHDSACEPKDEFSVDTQKQAEANEGAPDLFENDIKLSEEDSEAMTVVQKVTAEQAFNEAIVKLLVLLYQIDGKVTLTEQDLFDDVVAKLNWRSGVSLSAFINDAIHQARVAISQDEAREFLFKLSSGLSFDPARALDYAMDITEVDGKRSEDELELLALLSNRVLARGIVP